jgi:predicted ABC-type sugar transport system permease subunit
LARTCKIYLVFLNTASKSPITVRMFVFGLSSPWALLRLGGIAADFLAAALGRFSLLCALAAFVFAAGASGIGGAGTIDGTSSESSSPSCAAGASGLEALAPADS